MPYISDPPGTVKPFAGSASPSGWLLADGTAVSRTTYANLFAAIGTAYGTGDGSTTFNLPDLRGRVAVGRSPGGKADVDTLGDSDGLSSNLRSISHHHTVTADTAGSTRQGDGGNPNVTNAPLSTSGDGNNLDKPAYIVLNYIVKF